MKNLQIDTIFETLNAEQAETVATVLVFQISQPLHALSNALELIEEEPATAEELLPLAMRQVDRLAAILEQIRSRAQFGQRVSEVFG